MEILLYNERVVVKVKLLIPYSLFLRLRCDRIVGFVAQERPKYIKDVAIAGPQPGQVIQKSVTCLVTVVNGDAAMLPKGKKAKRGSQDFILKESGVMLERAKEVEPSADKPSQ
jgi:hypothetical protein